MISEYVHYVKRINMVSSQQESNGRTYEKLKLEVTVATVGEDSRDFFFEVTFFSQPNQSIEVENEVEEHLSRTD